MPASGISPENINRLKEILVLEIRVRLLGRASHDGICIGHGNTPLHEIIRLLVQPKAKEARGRDIGHVDLRNLSILQHLKDVVQSRPNDDAGIELGALR